MNNQSAAASLHTLLVTPATDEVTIDIKDTFAPVAADSSEAKWNDTVHLTTAVDGVTIRKLNLGSLAEQARLRHRNNDRPVVSADPTLGTISTYGFGIAMMLRGREHVFHLCSVTAARGGDAPLVATHTPLVITAHRAKPQAATFFLVETGDEIKFSGVSARVIGVGNNDYPMFEILD